MRFEPNTDSQSTKEPHPLFSETLQYSGTRTLISTQLPTFYCIAVSSPIGSGPATAETLHIARVQASCSNDMMGLERPPSMGPA